MRASIKRVLGGSALVVCAALVGDLEGYRSQAYRDQGGVMSICYGHTGNIKLGQRATREQCVTWLNEDLGIALGAVDRFVNVELSETRRAALGSFVYNVGEQRFKYSTLLARINARDAGACDELKRWVYHYDPEQRRYVKNAGLVNRRQVEYEVCAYEPAS